HNHIQRSDGWIQSGRWQPGWRAKPDPVRWFRDLRVRGAQGRAGRRIRTTNPVVYFPDAANNLTLESLEQKTFDGGSTFFVADVKSGVTSNSGLVDASVGTCTSNCGGQNVPEPTSLAIFGTT